MDQQGPQHGQAPFGQDRVLDAPARSRLDRKIALARGALFWERLWPALWLPGLVAGGFLALALLDVLPLLPFWAHAGLLGLFAVGLLFAVWRGLSPVSLPDDLSGRRRLEVASGLNHRPLSGIDDSLALGAEDPVSRALWEVHRRRLAAGLARLRIGLPVAGWGRVDPWGARAAIGLLLVVGLAASWGEGGARVMRALLPEPGRGVAGPGLTLDVWINPPTYTGKAPLFLDPRLQQAGTPIEVPAGSTVLAQVNGLEAKPVLRVDDRPTEFESLGATSHRATTVLTSGSRIAVANGRAELGAWPILVVADQPPTITFRQPPSQSDRNALRIDYAARDDYGIDKVSVRIRRVDDSGVAVEGEDPIEIGLGLPGLALKEAANSSYHDLTAHPWAGLSVAAVLTATDAIGQTGESEAQKIVLPERSFRHPVARAIVAERKKLAQAPAANKAEVSKNLAGIASRPGAYADDMVVFMGLKSAMGRLRHDDSKDGLASTLQLLWDIALRVEDGDVSLAMRELRQAQQAVEDALNRDADDQELARLMDELQRAIDKYIEAMTRQMMEQQQQGQQQEMQPLPPNAQLVDRQDLQRMLDKARELARSGNKDAARQMLSQLKEMMENLRTAQPGQSQQNQQMQQTMKMLQNLQDLAKRQRQLLDQSHQREQGQQGQQGQEGQQGQQGQRGQAQQGQRGQQGQGQQGQRGQQGQGQQGQRGQGQRGQGQGQQGQGDPGAADTQDAVRRMLGDLMRQMGEGGDIPDPFGRAERAMRDAANALRGGGEASGSQAEALDQLQKGAQQMAEEMARQMEGQQPGQGMGEGPGDPSQGPPRAQADRQGRDPLGRPTRNSNGQSRGHVEIPEEADIQRSREIFDELRRRGSEPSRPQIERDYIDRLLRRF